MKDYIEFFKWLHSIQKMMNKYESVNNMSVKFFKLLKNSHYVIINDFYELV
jgi:hypothetical protein